MYALPIQQIFIEPPTMYQTLFLDDGNIVVIKTQKSHGTYILVALEENLNKLLSYYS